MTNIEGPLASGEKRHYLVKGEVYPSIHSVLSLLSPSSFFPWDAAQLGIEAHKWVEDFYKNGISINDNFISGQIALMVVEWIDRENIKPYLLETRGWHSKFHYAGTIDLIGKKGDEYYLIDFKFANNLYPNNFIQMEAYRRMTHMEEEVAPFFNKIILLQYSKILKKVIPTEVQENRQLWKLFLASLEVWKYRQRTLIKRKKIK